jgi:hypothetical protein
MDPMASAAIIACGIAAVVLLAWVLWLSIIKPWIDELSEDHKDGWR